MFLEALRPGLRVAHHPGGRTGRLGQLRCPAGGRGHEPARR
jgi:hypothetical protein